ncbi:MAG: Crp/Fnr family transcriptional regulator [Chloroflexota bacterium]
MPSSSSEDNLMERKDFLQTIPLFQELQSDDLDTLARDFRLRVYGRDDTIYHQGDESDEMYIIVEGTIRIYKISPAGSETSLVILSQGDILGEFAMIDHRPRSATVKAVVPAKLLQIQSEKFVAYMREMPDLAIGMNRLLVEKIRWTATYAETIAQYDAAGRLLHTLLRYNELLGEEVEPGRFLLDLNLNQTDLASLVGARREWVNRLLRDWKKRGLIEYQSGKLTILDLEAVEDERDNRIEANYH